MNAWAGIATLTVAIVGALSMAPAAAQNARDYGKRPIRMLVPVPPGGSTDIVARIVIGPLTEMTGYTIVIDNRAGAQGAIATDIVARAAPDGYTLLFAYATHTTLPFINKVPYDPFRDFAPITQVSVNPLLVVVHPTVPVTSVKELIALAKSKPKSLNLGIATAGSAGHIAAELFKLRSGTGDGIVSVIYRGGGPSMVALLSGEVQMMFASVPTSTPYLKSGRLKTLATVGPKRLPYLPELPSLGEYGFTIEAAPWQALLGPANMPREIITRLYGEMSRVLKRPEVIERLAAAGADVVSSTPEEFDARLKRELNEYSKLIPTFGLGRQL
jgi:tripartite-type tricarboxylate transporter receptor subunit TctC